MHSVKKLQFRRWWGLSKDRDRREGSRKYGDRGTPANICRQKNAHMCMPVFAQTSTAMHGAMTNTNAKRE